MARDLVKFVVNGLKLSADVCDVLRHGVRRPTFQLLLQARQIDPLSIRLPYLVDDAQLCWGKADSVPTPDATAVQGVKS